MFALWTPFSSLTVCCTISLSLVWSTLTGQKNLCPVCVFLHFLFRRLRSGARRSPSRPLIATRSPTVICAPAFATWCLAMTEFRAECRLKTFVVCSFSPSPSSQRPLIARTVILRYNVGGSGSPPIQTTASHLPLHCDSYDCLSLATTMSISYAYLQSREARHTTARRAKVDLCNGSTSCKQQDNNCLETPPLNARACLPKTTCTHLFNRQPEHFTARRTGVAFYKRASSSKLLLTNIQHDTLSRDTLSRSSDPSPASQQRTPDLSTCFAMFCSASRSSCPSHKLCLGIALNLAVGLSECGSGLACVPCE